MPRWAIVFLFPTLVAILTAPSVLGQAPGKVDHVPDEAKRNEQDDTPLPAGALRGMGPGFPWVTVPNVSTGFSPDGKFLATAGWGQPIIHLWEVATGKKIRDFEGHEEPIWSLAFSPDGKRLASTSWDGTIRLWDVARGKALRCFGKQLDDLGRP
jgi:hypothetical protein